MKILVTGAGGFIGTRLIKSLLKNPDNSVYALSRDSLNPQEGAITLVADILDRNLDLSEYDLVYHLAAMSNPKLCETKKEEAWHANVDGTKNIVQKMKPGSKLIFISSAHVYANDGSIHKESDIPHPHSFYGLTKLVGEQLAEYHARRTGFNYALLRLFNSYSMDQPPGFIVPDVIQKYKKGGRIEISNPDGVMDLVHVEDVISVLSRAHEISGTYNLCSGHQIKVRDVYGKIRDYLGVRIGSESLGGNVSTGGLIGSNQKLLDLGFSFRSFGLP